MSKGVGFGVAVGQVASPLAAVDIAARETGTYRPALCYQRWDGAELLRFHPFFFFSKILFTLSVVWVYFGV